MNTDHSMHLLQSVEHLCGDGEAWFCHKGLRFQSDQVHFQPLLLISCAKSGSPQVPFCKTRMRKIILLSSVLAIQIIGA